MTKKPTYGEFEKRVKELEKEPCKRKREEEALWETENKWRSLVENAPGFIINVKRNGKIEFINRGVQGISAKEAIGQSVYKYIEPEYQNRARKTIKEVFETGEPGSYEVKGIGPDGHHMAWYETRVGPIKHDSQVVAVTLITTDISQRKLAEEALKESEAQKRAILDGSIDRIRLVDTDLRIIWANKTTVRSLNVAPEDLVGQHCYKLFRGRNTPCVECPSKKALDSGQIEHVILYRPEEQEVIKGETYVDSYGVPIKNESGDVVNLVQINRNITERKQAEEALQKAHDELERRVEERTAELAQANEALQAEITERKRAEQALKQRGKELEIKTSNLEEVNTALRVLLKKRDEDKIELEDKVLFNVKELIVPCLEKLKASRLNERQRAYANAIESNLNDIISPFSQKLSSWYLDLTPTEIQVANLVRHGKTTKEIAEFFNVSSQTIEFHRKNVREKIGIKNKKANLRTHLLSIQ